MKLNRRLIWLLILLALSAIVFFCLHEYRNIIPVYDKFLYCPFQSFRGWLFDRLPFSIGDLIYVAAGIALFSTLIKWIVWLFKFRSGKEKLASSFIRTINAVFAGYLLFIFGWGANYYKPSLNKYWELNDTSIQHMPSAGFKLKVKNDLTAFDTFLVSRINECALHYHSLTFEEINRRTITYYRQLTNSKLEKHGLGVKPTFFGYFMERLAVEGYYNPFSGEGQVNSSLPSFIMPFLISHEIAHQAGIAAEGDANLMAYALCTATDDSTFRYSCYLDIWLYTNRRLYNRDSSTALRLEKQLNKLTTAHLDTLEQLSRKYDNQYARYSSELFDTYLKMQNQKEGIRSYSNVAASAWALEQRRMTGRREIIKIP